MLYEYNKIEYPLRKIKNELFSPQKTNTFFIYDEFILIYRDKIRTGSVSSGFSEYDEGGGEFGAGVNINEWQAAWNVTNAIQVQFFT